MDWSVNDNITLSFVAAVAPGDAIEQSRDAPTRSTTARFSRLASTRGSAPGQVVLARRKSVAVWLVTASCRGAIAARCIMTARTEQGAIAWSVSLLTMPFVAVPAYLVFGRSKFEGKMVAYEQRKHEIDALVGRIRENLLPWNVDSENGPGAYRAVQKLSGMDLTRGNQVDLLVNGSATFDSISRHRTGQHTRWSSST
jgi:hypothetical protein